MPAVTEKLVLSVPEVAELLGVHRETAYRLARRIGIRIGRRLMVSRKRLDEYVETGGAIGPRAGRARQASKPAAAQAKYQSGGSVPG